MQGINMYYHFHVSSDTNYVNFPVMFDSVFSSSNQKLVQVCISNPTTQGRCDRSPRIAKSPRKPLANPS